MGVRGDAQNFGGCQTPVLKVSKSRKEITIIIITLFKLPTLNATSEHFTPLHIGEKLERAFDLST